MQEPSINVISVLILIGAVLGLFLACALVFMRRGNRQANLYLAALLLSLSVVLIDGFMHVSNYYSRYPHLLGLAWPAKFLIGPFLYFYVRELSSPKKTVFSWIQILHFLPMVVAYLLIFYGIKANGNSPRWACAICTPPFMEGEILDRDIALILFALQKNIYEILSFLMVIAYVARIKQSFSSLDKISLSWLHTLMLLFFTFTFIFIFFIFFSAYFGIEREVVYVLLLCCSLITSVMAFKAVLQPELFLRIEAAHQAELIRTDQVIVPAVPDMLQTSNCIMPKEKYRRSWLTDECASEIAHKLLKFMETDKPYLEPELTLPDLADKVAISPHYLSQVINREMKKSFFDFVNEYRVQEAKRLLSSPQHSHFSIFGIALDAGFNSKSAFYNAFGKYAGMTPSEFRKQLGWSGQGTVPKLQGRA